MLIQETWFPNIRSASCNLRRFPSALSHSVSPYVGRSFSFFPCCCRWTDSNNRLEISHRDRISPHFYGQHIRGEEKCVKMNIRYLPSDFPLWSRWQALVANTHTLLIVWIPAAGNDNKTVVLWGENKTFPGQWIRFFSCTYSLSVIHLLHMLRTLCVCMHGVGVTRAHKYFMHLLLHNAIMFLHTELIADIQAVCPSPLN